MLVGLVWLLATPSVRAQSAVGESLRIPVAEYRARVYASWLGQCIGNIYGLPHENQYIDAPGPETWPYGYSGNLQRLREVGGVFSDDDTDVEYIYLTAMEKFGPEPTGAELAGLWTHHMRDRVWLANRAALAAMHHGWTPPVTGRRDRNPHWFQIDPQLVNEIWAVTAPGMVRYAAEKSAWAASITNDSWGIEPTVVYGAMYAAAFFESDIDRLIQIGVDALPAASLFRATIEDVRELYRRHPDDWKAARAEMAKRYYTDEPALTKTIWNANLNGAAGILALLYGKGDFQRTLDLACAMGFDADNQAATMSGLLALIVGVEGLPRELLFPFPDAGWTEPFNDRYVNVSRHDMPDAGLKDMAARMAAQGERIILAHGGRKVIEQGVEYYVIDPNARFTPPLELAAGPTLDFEVGTRGEHAFVLSGTEATARLTLVRGGLPPGMELAGTRLAGTPRRAGVYQPTLRVTSGTRTAERQYSVVVHGPNLAPSATEVLASVKSNTTAERDDLWLVVGRSMYAGSVDVIRDGKRTGEGQSFYSLAEKPDATDYYGYRWAQPQSIGLIVLTTGVMEENGGWFASLGVEYRDAAGRWVPAGTVSITPSLPSSDGPYDKPNFADYWLRFDAVTTTAIRVIGTAGATTHWKNPKLYFTSVAELEVYGPLEQ